MKCARCPADSKGVRVRRLIGEPLCPPCADKAHKETADDLERRLEALITLPPSAPEATR